jgi:hypothetical protein
MPTAIGIDPATIADEYIRYFGKHNEIDLPAKILDFICLGGTPFNKH